MKCVYKLKNRKLEVKEIPLSNEEGFAKLLRDLDLNGELLKRLL